MDRQRIARYLQDYGVYAAVAALLAFNAVFTDHFLTVGNLRTQLIQVAPVVIVALGMALVIGTEGVDLSVGSVMALAAAVLPLYLGYGAVPAIAVALLAGVAVGGSPPTSRVEPSPRSPGCSPPPGSRPATHPRSATSWSCPRSPPWSWAAPRCPAAGSASWAPSPAHC